MPAAMILPMEGLTEFLAVHGMIEPRAKLSLRTTKIVAALIVIAIKNLEKWIFFREKTALFGRPRKV